MSKLHRNKRPRKAKKVKVNKKTGVASLNGVNVLDLTKMKK